MDDRERITVPGAANPWDVLRTDPVALLLGTRLIHPFVLGCVIAALIVAMIVLGPSTEARFIYTDF